MHRVSNVEALPGYRILVTFDDGVKGVVDLANMVGSGVFKALSDPAEFAKAFVDPATHTVAWPGGIDLCPDTLYRDIAAQERAA